MRSTRNFTYLTADATLGLSDVAEFSVFVCSGVSTLTLESPAVDYIGFNFDVVNDSNSAMVIACTNGFPNALDSGDLAAGQAARVGCAPDPAGGFTWYLVGQTAVTA